ncbi:hypothetical protein BHYA_0043g00320 [Botrytis hyacinthi]|uniref:Uncharacterized protein n=1 Tax=Botrytis hyacinthi TaxID=278943 RepID=A0A4Z1GTC9_9HELO|nr:hypothetical protein BHYA_0043g00320 [Botrytis hyacinthi]
MPPLRHSISQLFAPHPAFALRNSQSHEQSLHTAPSAPPNNDEMIPSLQPKRPTVPIPTTPSTPPPNPPTTSMSPPTYQSESSFPTASPSFHAPAFPTTAPIPPRTQIEALPPHTTPLQTTDSTSPFLHLTHRNGKFILDSAKRHPVFFTDRLRKAPTGVEANEYAFEDWKAGSPVASGYVYESGEVQGREAKL